jgi:predicted dehydrogenase
MAALIGRVWGAFFPAKAVKSDDAIKFGILGAANIASVKYLILKTPAPARLIECRPMALIGPAKSHPEVIIQAVAARDRGKADKFAKANGIPEVKGSYQG